ncbi:histidine phosphatase family protein [Zhouia spongiae]|uniref:Histidine phosphatase family protein n=1 Tax=Zhouia spongiae TaxID=2202721 RepID=A0ABY3YJU2_9FLAO|nr:histidine phosphatase family protein [Zhouia spongiae]UNY97869.1 histidine phosphatase family protein [Zhouia spongiae]
MKKLVLMRHGKSSWEYDVEDFERPLKKRGVKDTRKVATRYAKTHSFPEHIFSSPANRALTTCKNFMDEGGISENRLTVVDQLYDFGGNSVVSYIKSLDDKLDHVMVFGHNHAFTSIANIFGSQFIDNLPTAGLVVINFNVASWKDIDKGTTELVIIPKTLR